MLKTLDYGDRVFVSVREGKAVPYIAGRDGEYIYISDGSLTNGDEVIVRITEIEDHFAKCDVLKNQTTYDRDLREWSSAKGEYPTLRRHLQQIDPYKFEEFVAKLWERMGWETEVTSGSKDGGVDVIATNDESVAQKTLIQVKRKGAGNTLGVEDVRKYVYLLNRQDCDSVIIATTGSVSRQAEQESNMHGIKLIGGDRLCELIKQHNSEDVAYMYSKIHR